MARFKDVQDAVIVNRFKESERNPQVMRWITAEYAWIWNTNDLTFKHVSAMEAAAVLPVVAGAQQPVMPATFAEVEELYNALGDRLIPLSQDDFALLYRGVTSTGTPEHYTVVNRQLFLGPAPAVSANYSLAFRRRIAHLNAAGAIVAGKMTLDDDQPMWTDAEHDEVLIAGARARGKKRAQDPTWQADAAERDDLLDALLSDFGVDGMAKPAYPRDPL